ncbi:MAG TPA: hypothetical protein VFF73_25190, partial [Planctomycetota bacterium]|nr:hypothetical protein [Planctomycetota bacterium]
LAASAARSKALSDQLAQELASQLTSSAIADLGKKVLALVETYGLPIAAQALKIALTAVGVPAPLLSILSNL